MTIWKTKDFKYSSKIINCLLKKVMVVSVENKNLCTIVRKSRFTDKQEASGILSSLELKTPVTKIPVLGDILF